MAIEFAPPNLEYMRIHPYKNKMLRNKSGIAQLVHPDGTTKLLFEGPILGACSAADEHCKIYPTDKVRVVENSCNNVQVS